MEEQDMREREKFLHEHDKKREKELRESSQRGGKDGANSFALLSGLHGGDPGLTLDGLTTPNGAALSQAVQGFGRGGDQSPPPKVG